ncbi:MAG: Coenzyme F420 hydrogenase/dehydrogenase, beta subunit C-terminal domain [Candidatus Thorarchaeota archaeon]|nr:Coenzyme F420 hydrogenase/dehydrogenase, beta subunit C-terminal domain [Candidatus Thorarchaeota archaeon]
MSNPMYIVRSTDTEILAHSESGGAVASILKCALDAKLIDGVVAVKAKNGDRFAGIPVLLQDSSDLLETTGSLHCSAPNIARFVKEYLDGASKMKLAVVGKPCDIRAIIELQKREQIDKENVTLIGFNCTGTISPATARQMFREEFKINPDDIISEEVENGRVTITLKDGIEKSKSLQSLEKKGFGLRENCRRCLYNIPVFADIAIGKWGTEEETEKSSFVEVCSDKGNILFDKALKKGYIEATKASKKSIDIREEKDRIQIETSRKWREHDFNPILEMNQEERINYWMEEFSQCIKCYGCRDACPICYCESCLLEANRDFLEAGVIPPSALFPLTRLAHVADSCVACGQCQDACQWNYLYLSFSLSQTLNCKKYLTMRQE